MSLPDPPPTPPPTEQPPLPAPRPDPQPDLWQQPWAQDLVAFSTSLIFHVTVIVLGLIFVHELPRLTTPVQEQLIIPDATIIEGAEVGGIPNPGLGGDPNLSAAQSVDPNVSV